MSHDRTRRRLLELAGTAGIAALAGCATAVDQFSGQSNGGGATGTPVSTDQSGAGTPTSSGGSSTPGQNGGSNGGSWSTESVTIQEPDISLSSVPLPDTQARYARMGSSDAAATATLWGNWKCPYTQEFVLNMLPEVVDRFVKPGDLTLEYRNIAYLSGDPFLGKDAPRAARAGLAVWDIDAESYWNYFAHVFANQPQQRYTWAETSLLLRFAEVSGVAGQSRVRQSIESGAYSGPVQRNTEVATDMGVSSVPRVSIDGTVTAPTVDFQETLSQLEDAVQ